MIDSATTDTVTIRQLTLAVVLRNVNDQIELSNNQVDVGTPLSFTVNFSVMNSLSIVYTCVSQNSFLYYTRIIIVYLCFLQDF